MELFWFSRLNSPITGLDNFPFSFFLLRLFPITLESSPFQHVLASIPVLEIYLFFIFFPFESIFFNCFHFMLNRLPFFSPSFRRLAQVCFFCFFFAFAFAFAFYREIIMVSELNIVRWTGGLLWSHFIDKHTHIVYREREARCNYDELIERERERERVGWESDLLWSSDRSSRKRERRTSEQTGAEQSQENWKRKRELNWTENTQTRKERRMLLDGGRERGRNDWLWKDLMMSSAKLLIRYRLVNAGAHSFISIAEQHTHTPLYINTYI